MTPMKNQWRFKFTEYFDVYYVNVNNVMESLNSLLIVVRLDGSKTLHIIIEVSKLPLAISNEFGHHATQFTLALWKTHSLL